MSEAAPNPTEPPIPENTKKTRDFSGLRRVLLGTVAVGAAIFVLGGAITDRQQREAARHGMDTDGFSVVGGKRHLGVSHVPLFGRRYSASITLGGGACRAEITAQAVSRGFLGLPKDMADYRIVKPALPDVTFTDSKALAKAFPDICHILYPEPANPTSPAPTPTVLPTPEPSPLPSGSPS